MSDAEALGQRLREAREAKDLTLDDVERASRIRARFLEALERGDYSVMTPVQAQGFLRNYARFLGLDFELLLSELDSEKGRGRRFRRGQPPPAQEAPPPPATTTATRSATVRRIVTPVEPPRPAAAPRQRTRKPRSLAGNIGIVLIAGAVVVGLVLGATVLFDQLADSPDEKEPQAEVIPSATPPVLTEESLDETPSPDAEFTSAPTPEGGYTPPALTGTSVVVSIRLIQRTWLRVTVDGQVAREGLARPGEVWQFEGTQSVGVRANNAAALELTVNNQPQGTLGSRGQLFDYTYSLEGAAAPNTVGEPPTEGASESPTEAVVQAPTEAMFQPPNFTPIASPQQATLTSPPPTALVTMALLDGIPSSIPGQASGGVTASPPVAGATAIIIPGTTTIPLPLSETDTPTPTETIATATEPSSAPTLVRSPTPTSTPTITPTPSDTLTPTTTPSLTRTPSLTPTPTFTVTPSLTMTPTPTLTPTQTPFLPPRLTRTPSPPPK